jgi:alkanesulfonate monooxygenase SsuD/methylene tetrahydromethanopterin reductase-like flavin-dependent oxidoreductase (luciferase family)
VSGPRLAVSAFGAAAAESMRLAAIAERHNIDAILVGSIENGVPNSDDTYVAAAAAAAATHTTHLRIAVALDLRGSAPPLRVAEDIGVLDVMSAGRLELLFKPQPDPAWPRDLTAVLGAWSGWELDDGRTMPVTPSPVQPNIPAWTVDTSARPRTARPLSPGASVIFADWPEAAYVPDVAALHELRRTRDEAGASTVVIDLGATPARHRAEAMAVLGTIVAPCLRCASDEVGILALDATDWLLRRPELHRPPVED